MRLRQLIQAAGRRWYVTLAGLAVTVVLALHGSHVPGDWETSAGLVFLTPTSTENPNGYLTSGNAISTAGVISAIMNGSEVRDQLRTAGLVDQHTIVLHNSGNQWADNYDRPVLDIRVWGSDPNSVQRSLSLLVERASAELNDRQRATGAAENNWIRAQLVPAQPPVLHGPGSPPRAVATAILIGVTLTLGLAKVMDDAVRRWRHRQIAVSAGRPGPGGPQLHASHSGTGLTERVMVAGAAATGRD
jgi:hypothetical protein